MSDEIATSSAVDTATDAEVTESATGTASEAGGQADQATETEPKPEVKAPETYEFKLPEGASDNYGALKEFEPLARDLNLDQETAQKLVDHYADKILPKINQSLQDKWETTKADWQNKTENDQEIGGAKFKESVALAGKAMDKFATNELRALMNEYGIGNHPEMVRFMAKVGRAMSEDNPITGSHEATSQDSAQERINAFYKSTK